MAQTKELITSFRFRQDTLANWNLANPILKDGEFILIKDTAEYKVGNGVSKFSELPVRGLPAVQDKGQSILNVMSQKAVTDELNRLDGVDTAQTSEINSVKSGKVDKSSILSTFPTVEPTDHTTLVSAKEAYKKVKELSDKNTQLEQDLNVVRGDVQGVSFNKDREVIVDGYNISSGVAFSTWILLSDDMGGILTLTSGDTFAQYPSIQIFSKGSTTLEVSLVSNTEQDRLVVNASVLSNKPAFVCFNFFKNNLEIWVNGVSVGKKTDAGWIDKSLKRLILGNRGTSISERSKCNIYNVRMLNAPFTQQQVDLLYNQGRCDEVVLGDEWRYSDAELIPDPSKIYGNAYYNRVGDIKHYNNVSYQIVVEVIAKPMVDPTGNYGIFIGSSNQDGNVTRSLANYEIGVYSFYAKNIPYRDVDVVAYCGTNYVDNGGRFKVLSIKRHCLLNEYTPQYLTQTKWIDTGVSKQDIALTAPTFTYVKPYKQLEVADVAPTANPVAAGCFYVNKTAKKVYISTK